MVVVPTSMRWWRMSYLNKLERWMELRGLTQESRRMFRWVARDFLRYCKEVSKPIDKRSVIDYISSINTSSGHKRWRWNILRKCFNVWGLDWFNEDEEKSIMPKPSERVNRQVLSLEEFMRMYNVADKEWMKLALRIGIETGARRRQIAMLLREYFNPREGTLYIPPIKRSLDRIEILSDELIEMLSSYLSRRRDKDPHLLLDEDGRPLTPEKMAYEFQRVKKMAGINRKGLSWHSLRRAWTTWNFRAGMKELELMKAGGWKTMQMVAIYVSLEPTDVVRKEAGLHPLKRRGKRSA